MHLGRMSWLRSAKSSLALQWLWIQLDRGPFVPRLEEGLGRFTELESPPLPLPSRCGKDSVASWKVLPKIYAYSSPLCSRGRSSSIRSVSDGTRWGFATADMSTQTRIRRTTCRRLKGLRRTACRARELSIDSTACSRNAVRTC